MSKKVILKIDNLSKQFEGNKYKSLDRISFEIYEGESFALLGPSGCGKTTLMRIIAGLEMPDEGSIIIDGKNMTNVLTYRRPVNMMFQSYALFPHMTLWQNVAFGLYQDKISAQQIKLKVEEALDMVGMLDFAERKPHQISGGQQQRIALARSVIKRPKLLLLDEPLGALDRKTREKTQMELIKIQQMLAMTFVIVTHDQEEAMSMADRLAVMNHGELQQIGTPKEIYEYPKTKFVADFVGSVNMFQGIVISSDEELTQVNLSELPYELVVCSYGEIFEIGSEVWVALRPEEISISNCFDPGHENNIDGVIMDIGYLGNQIIYHVRLENESIVHVSLPTSARTKDLNLSVGSKAFLSWQDDDGVVLAS